MASIRSILRAVNLGLAALVAYGTATVSAQILGSIFEAGTPVASIGQSQNTQKKVLRRKTTKEFQDILDVNTFRAARGEVGRAEAGKTASGPSGPVQPTSDKFPIKVTLTGTFVMDGSSMAFIIGPDGRTERIYRLQDCLPQTGDESSQDCTPAQAQLTGVARDSVTVEMNQKQYIVTMEDDTLTPDAGEAPQAVSPNRPTRVSTPTSVNNGNGRRYPSTREGSNINVTVPAPEVEAAFTNFSTLLNQARVVPYMVEGKPAGFQIRKIVPGSVFDRLGLNNMDVIKSVNGQSVTDADQALRLFTAFRNEREIALDVERGGSPISFNYTVQ